MKPTAAEISTGSRYAGSVNCMRSRSGFAASSRIIESGYGGSKHGQFVAGEIQLDSLKPTVDGAAVAENLMPLLG